MTRRKIYQGMDSQSSGFRNDIDNSNTKPYIVSTESVNIRINMSPNGIHGQSPNFQNADTIGRSRPSSSSRAFPHELRSTNRIEPKGEEKMGPDLDRVDNTGPQRPPCPPRSQPLIPDLLTTNLIDQIDQIDPKRKESMGPDSNNADNTGHSCPPRQRSIPSEPRSTKQTKPKQEEKTGFDFNDIDNTGPPRPRPRSITSEPRSTNQTKTKREERTGYRLNGIDNSGPPRPPCSWAFSPEPKRKGRTRFDIGYIWPKDPRPGNPSRWSRWQRFSDVMTGKGPDIYVGRIRPRTSHHDHRHAVHIGKNLWGGREREQRSKTDWSLWDNDHAKYCAIPHCPDCYNVRKREQRDNFFIWARRGPEERYDFRTRKYQVPDEGTWSRVEYCDEPQHMIPLQYRDRYRRPYPAEHRHNEVYGIHGNRNQRFRY